MTIPRSFCCAPKYFEDLPPIFPAASIITTTIATVRTVSGMLSTIMLTKVMTSVTNEFTICGILWLIS